MSNYSRKRNNLSALYWNLDDFYVNNSSNLLLKMKWKREFAPFCKFQLNHQKTRFDCFCLNMNWLKSKKKSSFVHSVTKLSTNYLRSLEASSSWWFARIKLSFTFFQNSSTVSCCSRLYRLDFFLEWSKIYWFTRHLYFPLCSFSGFSIFSFFHFWSSFELLWA